MWRIGRHDRAGEGQGQAMAEFAIILPVFILILVGLFDVGRAVYAYHTVNNAAREAARLAIVDQTVGNVQDEAIAAGSGLGLAAGDVVVGFEEDDGSACSYLGQARVFECRAIVTVTYAYVPATPIIGNLLGAIDLVGESSFPVANNCREPDIPQCPLGG